jgi:hypothetical protein
MFRPLIAFWSAYAGHRHRAWINAGLFVLCVCVVLAIGWKPDHRRPDGVLILGTLYDMPVCIEREVRACWLTEQ